MFSIVLVSVAVFLFVNKSYYFYPSLPIENVSASYAIEKLDRSDDEVAEIAELEDYTWFLTKSSKDEGFAKSDENIKQRIHSYGWEFKEKVGSALFFQKEDEELIVTTQMWTDKYIFVQVQNKFREV